MVAIVLGVAVLAWASASSSPGSALAAPEAPVTAMDLAAGPANNSPIVVADPTDARFVVIANRLDAPDYGCALQISGDDGRSWVSASPLRELPAGADKCYAPEVAFDRHGVLYYLFVGLAGRGNEPVGAFLTTSADRGRTFGPPRQILGPLNFAVRMAIDHSMGQSGRLHLVWLHATSDPPLGGFGPPPNPIMASFSDDGGKTFSAPVQVSDPGRDRVVAPGLALSADQTVHVAYYDLGRDAIDYQGLEGPVWDEPWLLVLATSTDGGRSFGPGAVVDEVTPHERVMLVFTMPPPAVAASGHQVCLAWTDARHGDPDVLLRCSGDRGGTWSGASRVNDDALGNGAHQYLPQLGFSRDGRLDAAFYDRRYDPQNGQNDLSFTYSSDRGRHFAPNLKLTHRPSDVRIGQQYVHPSAQGQVEFGGRLGLQSSPSQALVAWADTRNSDLGNTEQDLFATVVRFSTPDRSLSRWLGISFIVGGLLALVLALAGRNRRRLVSTTA